MNSGKPFKPKPLDEELYQACAKGSFEEVQSLLDQGANPTLPHWEEAWCDGLPEDYYCVHEAACNPDLRVFDLLVERGADPNVFDVYDRQPLALAAANNTLAMVRHLVELGNNPDNPDFDGGSVLTYAALNPDIQVVEFLLEQGAQLDNCDPYISELAQAIRKGTPERVRFFVEHGSSLDIVDELCDNAPAENISALREAMREIQGTKGK